MKIVFCVLICQFWQISVIRTAYSLTISDDASDDEDMKFAAIDLNNSNPSDVEHAEGMKQPSELSRVISKRIQEKVIHIPKGEILHILSLMETLKELGHSTENRITNTENSRLLPLTTLTPPRFENNTINFNGKNQIPTRYLNKLSFLRKTFLKELERRQNDGSNSTIRLNRSNHDLENKSNFQETNSWESNNISTTRREEIPIPDILVNAFSRQIENTEFELYRNWTQGRTWENLSSGEKERFLEEVLGSEHKYGKIQVWFPSILYPIISLLGIPGNILTCLSIYKIPYMRTPSNFFIFNLALSDLLSLSFVLPMEVFLIWTNYPIPLGKIGCNLAIVVSELFTYASVLTLITFTIERYVVVCLPTKKQLHFGKCRTIVCIVGVWIISLITASCWTFFTDVTYVYYHPSKKEIRGVKDIESDLMKHNFTLVPESAMCMSSQEKISNGLVSLETGITTVLYLLPSLLLPFIHLRMTYALNEVKTYQGNVLKDATVRNAHLASCLKMQRIVFVIFLLCWTPHHVDRIMYIIITMTSSWTGATANAQEWVHLIAGCSYMLHSAINPFLYSIYSKRFRNGIQEYIRTRYKSKDQYMTEDSLDQFIRSFNRGRHPGKESKRVVNKSVLKRHFDYESSDVKRIDLLRKDMVVIQQSQSEGITRFKKFSCSSNSKHGTKSVVLSTSIHASGSVRWANLKKHFRCPIKKNDTGISKTYSLKFSNKNMQSQISNCRRTCKSEGI